MRSFIEILGKEASKIDENYPGKILDHGVSPEGAYIILQPWQSNEVWKSGMSLN